MEIVEYTLDRYDDVMELLRTTAGVSVRSADSREATARCLDALARLGILKTHLDVFVTNDLANTYWQRRGWIKREDINRYSLIRGLDENA